MIDLSKITAFFNKDKGLEQNPDKSNKEMDKKLKFIVFLGFAGMLLILVSSFWDTGSIKETGAMPENSTEAVTYSSDDYAARLEERLTEMLGGIKGVGRTKVMVTLENTGGYVYAKEEKKNVDTSTEQPAGAQSKTKVYSKENTQETYIIIDNGGKKQALIETEIQPKIKGVVVICDGASNIAVKQSIINVVTTALDIPTTRVCVEEIS